MLCRLDTILQDNAPLRRATGRNEPSEKLEKQLENLTE